VKTKLSHFLKNEDQIETTKKLEDQTEIS